MSRRMVPRYLRSSDRLVAIDRSRYYDRLVNRLWYEASSEAVGVGISRSRCYNGLGGGSMSAYCSVTMMGASVYMYCRRASWNSTGCACSVMASSEPSLPLERHSKRTIRQFC